MRPMMENLTMRLKRRPRSARGFTLVELMVVIAIISLLIAILLPSLGRARHRARQLVCRNNIRNIFTGILQYAYSHKDRVPFMEDININDPTADPFDEQYKTTVGVVLNQYVPEGSWRCPEAIKGFPENAGPDGWTMTYWFRSAGAVGEGVPFGETNWGTGDSLDPIMSNYVNFDGRPLKYLSGRRYTPSDPGAPNHDGLGPWRFSFPIIADLITGNELLGTPRYPHYGVIDERTDLKAARAQFEANAGTGEKPARMELHAEGDRESRILLTRSPYPHKAGY